MYVLIVILVALAVYGFLIEPYWIAVRRIQLGSEPTLRVVHLSDLHYWGNRAYLRKVVRLVNAERPDAVCITGDFVFWSRHLPGLLEQLSGLSAPIFAVTGNWDHWSEADISRLAEFCARSGGRLLSDESVQLAGREVTLSGAAGEAVDWLPEPSGKRILLVHYPMFVVKLGDSRFDLVLAGHSHGGQVRLPVIGAFAVPRGTGRYSYGLYNLPAGVLYVTSGVGTSLLPFRLNCRPEIAVIEL